MFVCWFCFVLIVLLFILVLVVIVWIDDEIYVLVCFGVGFGYWIVYCGLKSGIRVEFLGEDGDWVYICFGDIEGYVGKQYISCFFIVVICLEQISGDCKDMESCMIEMCECLSSVEVECDWLCVENEEFKGLLSSCSDELENLCEVVVDLICFDQVNCWLNEEFSMLCLEFDQVKVENVMLCGNNIFQ